MEVSDESLSISRVEYERQRVEALNRMESLAVQVAEFERSVIVRAIELCRGNQGEAAIRLGITRQGLWRKLRRKI